jgi:hypothetical protein
MSKFVPDVNNFFAGIEQVDYKDYNVTLPIFYYDNTAFSAIYTASTSKMRKYLPSPDMHPVEIFPGRCLLVFTAFEYRKTDIDPYNEFSITAIITYGKKAVPGLTSLSYMMRNCFTAYIIHLPVTSERARRGGVEMAGYPKFIADISFTDDVDHKTCTLSEKGKRILTLKGRKLATSPGKLTKYILHTVKAGKQLRANLYLNPKQYCQALGRNNAQMEIGTDHKICAEIKDMGLSKSPLLYQYIPSYEAMLFMSKNLIDN